MSIIRYTRDDFFLVKSNYDFMLDDNLYNNISYIKSIINKNLNLHKNNDKKNWRYIKPTIKKKNMSVLETYCGEINSILNKISPKNYNKLVEQIMAYYKKKDLTDEEHKKMLTFTINNIFDKAVMQPVYCPYYVKFLNTVDSEHNIINLIEEKCNQYKDIVKQNEKIDESSMTEQEKYDLFCKNNKEKIFKNGFSQFIGELFNKEMITSEPIINNLSFFTNSLETIIDSENKSEEIENLILCVCNLMKTVFEKIKKIDTDKDSVMNIINKLLLLKDRNLPKRLYFKLLDIKDLL